MKGKLSRKWETEFLSKISHAYLPIWQLWEVWVQTILATNSLWLLALGNHLLYAPHTYNSSWLITQRQQLAFGIFHKTTSTFRFMIFSRMCQLPDVVPGTIGKALLNASNTRCAPLSCWNKTERQSNVFTLGKWLPNSCFHRIAVLFCSPW